MSFTKLLAYATIVLAVATIFVAFDTHRLANQAISQSEDNAAALKTAKEAAKAATITASSTRAWLCTVGSTDFSASDFKKSGMNLGPVFGKYLTLTNSGSSPAIGIKGQSDYKVLSRNDPLPSFPTSTVDVGEGTSIVGPNGTLVIGPFPFKNDDLPLFESGERRFIVWISVEYSDIFDVNRKHISSYTFEIHDRGMTNQNRPFLEISSIGQPAVCE